MSEIEKSEAPELEGSVARAEASLSRLLEWIRAADGRLRFVLPLTTAMLGALAVLVPPAANWTMLGGIAAAFAVFFLVLSIAFSACSSFPRTTGPLGSLIYFGGICSRDLQQFEATFREMNAEAYLSDLLKQCHRNAQIAERKYAWLQRAIGCLFVAAIPWAVAIFELYSRGA